MTIGFRQIIAELSSHAQSLGTFDRVGLHEPANAPGNGLQLSFWVDRVRPLPATSGLASTSAVVVIQARMTGPLDAFPADDIDANLMDALDLYLAALNGDFELSGSAMAVDLLGMSKVEQLRAEAGYLEQQGQRYRAYMVWIPVLVVNAWTQTA